MQPKYANTRWLQSHASRVRGENTDAAVTIVSRPPKTNFASPGHLRSSLMSRRKKGQFSKGAETLGTLCWNPAYRGLGQYVATDQVAAALRLERPALFPPTARAPLVRLRRNR
jgi:hypothetical protein